MTPASELAVAPEQRQPIHGPQQLTPPAASATRRRSIPTISEERSRFRIVKIDSYVDRGRWHCHNFADPPLDDSDVGSSAQDDSGSGAVGGDDDSAPSQIYYIPAGQNDGDLSDLSKKFYVSTIVYGEHGHPVLQGRMSPLELLRQASDVSTAPSDAGETLSPSPRGTESNQSLAETLVNDVDETDVTLLTTAGICRDMLPVDDDNGHVVSATETDVMENDLANPFSGVAMAAHSSMPPLLMSCSSQSMTSANGYDDVSRRPVTSLPLRRQDGVDMHGHKDVFGGSSACPTLRLLSTDDVHSTRYTSRFNFTSRIYENTADITDALCMLKISRVSLEMSASILSSEWTTDISMTLPII